MTTPVYPLVRYPNYITPHGQYHIFKGRIPDVVLTSFDGTVEFYLMGGRSIADHTRPEGVRIKGIKGMVAPWQMIDQKGATQDGTTFVTALNDPIELQLEVEARGRDPKYLRKVLTDLYTSIDSIKTSTLAFYTHGQGRWWGKVRWSGPSMEPMERINVPRQNLTLNLRVDEGFWRSYDDTDQFRFTYAAMVDLFTTDYSGSLNLGPNWPLFYTGTGGYISTNPASTNLAQARWYESGLVAREVVAGPYKNVNTTTDNQVISMVVGTIPEVNLPDGAYDDLWGRMSRDGSGNWTGYGVRARIGRVGLLGFLGLVGKVRLSRFNNFVETLMREEYIFLTPMPTEKFTLVCGYVGDSRHFRVLRNGLPVLIHKELGTGSLLGASYRGVGFGMKANSGSLSQASPAWIRSVSAGDNATISQAGFIQRVNVGDQLMYDDYTLFGPGTFRIYNGPNSPEFVEFGPLLANQIMLLRSHPGKRSVHDLTVIPPTPQELDVFQQLLNQFLSFAFANNVPPLIQAILSSFGIMPPQGNPHSLLTGRFSEDSAIPPKSPGSPLQAYYVKVEIVNGNADSKIIASGTPLRRYPI